MKYVFGINITENRNNIMFDGEIFHSNSTNSVLGDAFIKCDDLTKKYEKQTSLPIWMNIIKYLSLSIACLILYGIMEALSDLSLREVYASVPVLFFIAAALFTVWLVLYLIERKKKNQHGDEYNRDKNYIQNIETYAKDLLHIPEDAEIMEVLSFRYKIKKQKSKVIKKRNSVNWESIRNCPVYVSVKGSTLHIADLNNEWSIPLYSITGIKKINERVFIPQWTKEIPYNKGAYKKYKITMHCSGSLYFKPYYSLCITWKDESYELFIPPYELDVLSSLVGLK